MAKDSTHQAAAKRLRRKGLQQGNDQRAKAEAKHPFRNESHAGPVAYQPGSYKKG